MTNIKTIQKAYVKDDTITIVCPSCHINKTIPATNFRGQNCPLEIRCKCGHSFSLYMEFRKYPRKETFLPGDYTLEKLSSREFGHTKVINLSLQGACFEVRGLHDITPEMKGELVFILDNEEQTLLFRKVIIRSVRGSHIGCEFIDPGNSMEELDGYING